MRILLLLTLMFFVRAARSDAEEIDWRRKVIYFALLDRFANGDPRNDHAHGVLACNNASDPHAYQGGDLAGLNQRLNYIREIGATALWITPLYKGVPLKAGENCGFPGYWAELSQPYNFQMDPRFGAFQDFDQLIDGAHARSMPVILDMVVNHAGYQAPLVRQRPDWFNVERNCHWQGLPEIYCPLAGLPDFDHRKSEVQDYLIDLHTQWLDRFSFDAIRMDTVKHVEPDYFRKWIASMRERRSTALYVLGELLDEGSYEKFSRYLAAGFDGLFNFPLRRALIETFALGESVDRAAHRVAETIQTFGMERAKYFVNLLDNHDVPRFSQEFPQHLPAEEKHRRYLMALTALMTVPGIPQIYYGNELGMLGGSDPDNRRFMPEWGFNAELRGNEYVGFLQKPGRIFSFLQHLTHLRNNLEPLQIGDYHEVWRQNGSQNSNVWAFVRSTGSEKVLVAFNNGLRATDFPLPVNVGRFFVDGTRLRDALGMTGFNTETVSQGKFPLNLPGQSAVVLVEQ